MENDELFVVKYFFSDTRFIPDNVAGFKQRIEHRFFIQQKIQNLIVNFLEYTTVL